MRPFSTMCRTATVGGRAKGGIPIRIAAYGRPAGTAPGRGGLTVQFNPSQEPGIMGSTDDKAKGQTNEAAGKVKQAAGNLTGDREMKRKGEAQETKGDVQQSVGKAKDAVKKAVDRA